MASSSLQFSTTLSSLIHPKSPSSSSSLIKLSPKTLSFPLSFSLSKSYPFQLRTRFNRPQSINSLIVRAVRKLAELDPLPVSSEPGSEFPNGSGVYGVYDANGDLQFIGISRNIAASIATHKKLVPELCSSVKVGVVEGSTPDRTVLTDAWKSWMEEHIATSGKVPPGNEKGNTTWVRQPQKKANIRLTPGRHVQLTVPLEDLIDRLVKEKEVVAFIKGSRTSPQCGFSQRVVGILESHGVDFECVDVLDEEYNFGLRETLKKYSNWPTFPQVFVKGELLGGCDIISDMAAKGELVTLFKK